MAIKQIKNKDGTMVWELYLDLRKGAERRPLRRRFDCSARTRKEVKRLETLLKRAWKEGWLDQALNEAERPSKSPGNWNQNSKFGEFAFQHWLSLQGKAGEEKMPRLKRLIEPETFGDKALGDFKASDRKWYRERMRTTLSKRKKTFADKSIHEDERVLLSILDMAVEDEIIPYNPLHRIKCIPVRLRKPATFDNWLMPEDLVDFFVVGDEIDEENNVLARTAYETGGRLGELIALEIGDIFPERRLIHLCKSYSHREKEIKDTKGREERWQVVSPELIRLLLEQNDRHSGTPLIFPSKRRPKGKPGFLYRSSNTMDRFFDNVFRALNKRRRKDVKPEVRRISMHGFRHSSATHLAMLGATEEQIRRFLGHSSTQLIQVYVNIAKKMTDTAVPKMLGSILGAIGGVENGDGGSKVVDFNVWAVHVDRLKRAQT